METAYSYNTETNKNDKVIKYTYNDDESYMEETLFPNNTYGKKVVIYSAEGSVLRREEYFKSGRLNIIYEYSRSGNPNTLVYSEERRDDEQNSLIYKTEYGENGNVIRRTTYVNGIDYEIFELQNGVLVKTANGNYTDPTSEEIYNRITALKNNEYPEGTVWTNDNKYEWDLTVPSSLGISRFIGYGCQAFAMIASDAAFGNAPAYRYDNDGTATVRVGDILRLNNDTHSVIVLAIDGDTLTIAEGNYNGTIHWGRTISLSGCGFTYGYTRYRPN